MNRWTVAASVLFASVGYFGGVWAGSGNHLDLDGIVLIMMVIVCGAGGAITWINRRVEP